MVAPPRRQRFVDAGRIEPGRHVDRELRPEEAANVLREEFGIELPEPLPDVVRPTGSWADHVSAA